MRCVDGKMWWRAQQLRPVHRATAMKEGTKLALNLRKAMADLEHARQEATLTPLLSLHDHNSVSQQTSRSVALTPIPLNRCHLSILLPLDVSFMHVHPCVPLLALVHRGSAGPGPDGRCAEGRKGVCARARPISCGPTWPTPLRARRSSCSNWSCCPRTRTAWPRGTALCPRFVRASGPRARAAGVAARAGRGCVFGARGRPAVGEELERELAVGGVVGAESGVVDGGRGGAAARAWRRTSRTGRSSPPRPPSSRPERASAEAVTASGDLRSLSHTRRAEEEAARSIRVRNKLKT
eukprot:2349385-Rhodomonas_salina.2